jgi:hypothetical protein
MTTQHPRAERADDPRPRVSGWRFGAAAAVGAGHAQRGQACQDAVSAATWPTPGDDDVFVGIAADGAGSASGARLAALLVAEHLMRFVRRHLLYRGEVQQIDRAMVLGWLERMRGVLQKQADQVRLPMHELACTVNCAIVGRTHAVFFQVGDGAMVTASAEQGWRYDVVHWPSRGEYANTTYFLCEPDFEKHVIFEQRDQPVTEVAMFTDGLDALLLDYAKREAHMPFFEGIFPPVRDPNATEEALSADLEQYLGSDTLNARTTDDKSLVLASRR